MTNYLITALIITLGGVVAAQTQTELILSEVAANNKTIISASKSLEYQRLENRTGITLPNPEFGYDFMSGTPETAGNQVDMTITQPLDFPTSYLKRKQISDIKDNRAEYEFLLTRQRVLLEARLICVELVYRNKLYSKLLQRNVELEELQRLFKRRLEEGEGNILDLNKTTLQLIEVNALFLNNQSAINSLTEQLTSLNGGKEVLFTDTVYPDVIAVPAFESFEAAIEKNDPIRKILLEEEVLAQKEVELYRALSLPQLEAGYHYQGILGQKFQGIHFGATIPIWEKHNTVKAGKARTVLIQNQLDKHKTEHYHEIKQLYEQLVSLELTISMYREVFENFNNNALLKRALELGQISLITYFLEMNYFYQAYNNYLEAEKEYHSVLARLNKYIL